MANQQEILEAGDSICFHFSSYNLSIYKKNYDNVGNPNGIKRVEDVETDTLPLFVVISKTRFQLLWQLENGIFSRINGAVKRIITEQGSVGIVEGISPDLTFSDETPFTFQFNTEPLLPMSTVKPFALISVKGTEMFDPPIVMQWVLNSCTYKGKVAKS